MARARKNLTVEQRIEVTRRYRAGETARALAAELGISARHVTRLAKEETGEGIAVRDPSEPVCFRAARSELDAFDAEWRARGFETRSQALRAVVRARCGMLDVSSELIGEFAAAWGRSRDLTDAGMALAKAVHRGRLSLTAADRQLVSDLVDLGLAMTHALGAMKDHARSIRGAGLAVKGEGGHG